METRLRLSLSAKATVIDGSTEPRDTKIEDTNNGESRRTEGRSPQRPKP